MVSLDRSCGSAGGRRLGGGRGCVYGDWFLVERGALLAEEGGGMRSNQSLLRVLAMHHQTLCVCVCVCVCVRVCECVCVCVCVC